MDSIFKPLSDLFAGTSAYSAASSVVAGSRSTAASSSTAPSTAPSAPPADEMDHPGKLQQQQPNSASFSALETMDRFLETNEGNLLVASLVSLEGRTNISRRYLARAFLLLLLGYFLFSNSVLDLLTHLLMFLYPSYRSYLLLQNVDRLSKEDLVDILKYWIFIGLFATVDFALGYFIPFASMIKLILIINCVLPRRSPTVQLAHAHFVTPLYRHLQQNESIQQVNEYVSSLASSLKATSGSGGDNADHQD